MVWGLGGGWGERLVEHCTLQNRNPVLVFLYHCISDGNQLFSENYRCHFHFILHVMSDKAAFVRGALFCVQRYHGNIELSRSNSASRWQKINLPSKTRLNCSPITTHWDSKPITTHFVFRKAGLHQTWN